jgi:hypothetical protein
LSWELRTSTSLGRLWFEQGKPHEALELVRSVLDQLTEGHATPDVRDAVALREALEVAIALPRRPAGMPRAKPSVNAPRTRVMP